MGSGAPLVPPLCWESYMVAYLPRVCQESLFLMTKFCQYFPKCRCNVWSFKFECQECGNHLVVVSAPKTSFPFNSSDIFS